MSSESLNSSSLSDADTERFCEMQTLSAEFDTADSQSIFNVPTQAFAAEAPEAAIDAPRSDAYLITHELAAGGYGTIWNGVQTNVNRRVAIKSLNKDVRVGAQYGRISRLFRQEAMTTAYLQHPNVVPVYDLTNDTDGSPLLVMKLIEGRQWNRVLADDFATMAALEFLEVHVPVLINVAQAVAFAHSKGIIHRDIKPSQVMIGSYGEVVLMDWGLAMAVRDEDGQVTCDPAVIMDAQSPLVKPVSPAGTPGYMAPEQLEKNVAEIGPRTDVYLLGAVLYELLTGLRPQKPSSDSLKRFPETGQIIKPELRTPNRDIPAQLSLLAMEAMAPRPSERIDSALEFVSGLKDYLVKAGRRGESMALVTDVANTVISCEHTYDHLQTCLDKLDRALAVWPENQMATYLRHQTLVTFARTALTNHDLKLALHQADRLITCHERDAIMKEVEAAEAEYRSRDSRIAKAHTQAHEDRDRAEALVRFMLLDLHVELRSIGRADLVYQVASHALKFFDSLREEDTKIATLQNRAIAYLQIGDVLSEQARRDEAEMAYSRTLDIANSIGNADPDNSEWKILTCRSLNAIGRLHFIMGRLDVAATNFDKSLTICGETMAVYPNDIEIQRLRGRILHGLSLVYWRSQDNYNALLKIDEALSLARKFYQGAPANCDYQSDLATFLASRVNILREMGDVEGAVEAAYESLAIRIALSDQFPGNTACAEDVFWIRANLGSLLIATGDLEGAVNTLRQDLAARRRMFEEDAASVVRTIGLTFQLSLIAEASFLLSKMDETERLLAECLMHSRRLAQLDDSNPTVVSRYAYHLVQLAELKAAQAKWQESEKYALQALERARYSYWLSPNNVAVMRPLVQALALCARIDMRHGKTEDAYHLVSESKNLLQQITGNSDCPAHRALVARISLGTCNNAERETLLQVLRQDRRLDPYLEQWSGELSVEVDRAVG